MIQEKNIKRRLHLLLSHLTSSGSLSLCSNLLSGDVPSWAPTTWRLTLSQCSVATSSCAVRSQNGLHYTWDRGCLLCLGSETGPVQVDATSSLADACMHVLHAVPRVLYTYLRISVDGFRSRRCSLVCHLLR